MLGKSNSLANRTGLVDTRGWAPLDDVSVTSGRAHPRIALVTPYNGGNLGDAAIQDSMIANIRLRHPKAEFSGICLNLENFLERHGNDAFPLCGMDLPFYHMLRGTVGNQPKYGVREQPGSNRNDRKALIKSSFRSVKLLWRGWKGSKAFGLEVRHWVQGYRFVRRHDLIIVSGGGQINEEWGGPWGQPYALFKWAVLARLARVPYVIASVGVGKMQSKTARLLISITLRLSQYRSYRDKNTKSVAVSLLPIAKNDPVVPDHVLALPASEIPSAAGIRLLAKGRPIIAISPIAYAKPEKWPTENRATYERYMVQMARVIRELLDRDCFLMLVCSSLWDDESAISDLLGHVGERSGAIHIPSVSTWRALIGCLLDVDFLIASRLHSVILGLVAQTPTVAISFEPKVEWVMEDLGQTNYLVGIRDFEAEDVLTALDRIAAHRNGVIEHVTSCRTEILSASAPQYDALAEFAMASRQH